MNLSIENVGISSATNVITSPSSICIRNYRNMKISCSQPRCAQYAVAEDIFSQTGCSCCYEK